MSDGRATSNRVRDLSTALDVAIRNAKVDGTFGPVVIPWHEWAQLVNAIHDKLAEERRV